jgi:hypothetical protein
VLAQLSHSDFEQKKKEVPINQQTLRTTREAMRRNSVMKVIHFIDLFHLGGKK